MGVVAVVTVVAVVLLGRVGPGAARAGDAVHTTAAEPPEVMAGGYPTGKVPPRVAAAVDEPVVGVHVLDELPPELADACSGGTQWDEDGADLEYAFATPGTVDIALVGRLDDPEPGMPRGRMRQVCSLTQDDGRFWSGGGSMTSADEDATGGMSSSCCDENGMGWATAGMAVPPDTAWALVPRGGWHLAYPVKGRTTVHVTWSWHAGRFGEGEPPPANVVLVDRRGNVVGEQLLGNQW